MKKLFTLLVATLFVFSLVGLDASAAITKKINANIKTKDITLYRELSLMLPDNNIYITIQLPS